MLIIAKIINSTTIICYIAIAEEGGSVGSVQRGGSVGNVGSKKLPKREQFKNLEFRI